MDEVPRDLKDERMYYMERYVDIFSQLVHWWMNWLFVLGFKRPLEMEDLGSIPEVHSAEYNHRRFKNNFKREIVSRAPNLILEVFIFWQPDKPSP